MYISNNISWIMPHMEDLRPLGLNLRHLKEIKGVKIHPLNRIQPAEAITYKYPNGDMEIFLYLTYQKKFKPFKYRGKPCCHLKRKPFSRIYILECLAHELSHACKKKHWLHTPSHQETSCHIMLIFMLRLIDEGYVSEEEELAELKKLS